MRVRTNLRDLRGPRTLGDASAATQISRGDLSRIERGYLIPTDAQAAALASFYGPPEQWWPPSVARIIAPDQRPCPACGEPLPPSAARSRRYHRCCRRRRKAVIELR